MTVVAAVVVITVLGNVLSGDSNESTDSAAYLNSVQPLISEWANINQELRTRSLSLKLDDPGWLSELEDLGVRLVEVRRGFEGLDAPPGWEDIKAGFLAQTDHLALSAAAFVKAVAHTSAGNEDEAENFIDVATRELDLAGSKAFRISSLIVELSP